MDYETTLEYLFHAMPPFQQVGGDAYKPGLDRIRNFCRSLGDPQNDFLTVHIAGTNGKGSVAHTLAAILQQAGYRTGLFTSPHLRDFRERIRLNGTMIPQQAVIEFTETHRQEMERIGLSFFEMTTAMAFDWFARSGAEVAVIETGLGGRLDSTNIIRPLLSIITNIGLEHTKYLGDTIAKIATEKAGIIKPGISVVIGESHPESDPVFLARAEENRSSIRFADRQYRCTAAEPFAGGTRYTLEPSDGTGPFILELDLSGDYQRKNIVTVRTALDMLQQDTRLTIPQKAIVEGCRTAAASTGLLGRWQILGEHPLIVCDTGHNGHGLRLVAEQIAHQPRQRLYMVLGVVNDKDLSQIIPYMPRDAHYIFTQAAIERALPAERLREAFAAAGMDGEVVPSIPEALRHARELASTGDMIFVGGSTFTVAEVLENRPNC